MLYVQNFPLQWEVVVLANALVAEAKPLPLWTAAVSTTTVSSPCIVPEVLGEILPRSARPFERNVTNIGPRPKVVQSSPLVTSVDSSIVMTVSADRSSSSSANAANYSGSVHLTRVSQRSDSKPDSVHRIHWFLHRFEISPIWLVRPRSMSMARFSVKYEFCERHGCFCPSLEICRCFWRVLPF